MSTLEWILSISLFIIYVCLIFTVAYLTFKKGRIVLGILGIFLPILWLIGAVLPAKEGSRYEAEERRRWEEQAKEWSQ